jgi:hypothetical protein
VYLFDPNPKDPNKAVIKEATTGDAGNFAMSDIPAGDYILFCEKSTSKRVDRQRVRVEPGQVLRKKLELLLP